MEDGAEKDEDTTEKNEDENMENKPRCLHKTSSIFLRNLAPTITKQEVESVSNLDGKGARCSSVVRAFAHGGMGRWIDPSWGGGARCSSVVRAFAHGGMGRWIDPSRGGPIELFLFPASALRRQNCY